MTEHWESYDPTVKPPLIREQYPRLRRNESIILRNYLQETGVDSVKRLRTAVTVGEGEVPGVPKNFGEEQTKVLSQWKIDAVVDRAGRQEVIELKSRATHTAVGQVLAYDVALGERDDEPTTSRPVIAAFRAHPDLAAFAKLVNVTLHIVPDVDPSVVTRNFFIDRERFRR